MTELPHRLLPRPAPPVARAERVDGVDVLSDVLRTVRLTGALFFLVEARTPWATAAPAAATFSRAVLPRAQHLISYHVITEGSCWAGLEGEPAQWFEAGDILVVPHGDPYFLAASAGPRPALDSDEAVWFFRRMAEGALPTVVHEGGDGPARTEFICGFLGCDARPFNPVLAALPKVLHLRGGGAPLGPLTQFALAELRAARAGRRDVLRRLSELMFVEVVRRHLDGGAGRNRPDWLAGLRDPLVAQALAQLHGAPARAWTLDDLAGAVGSSRSVLVERFHQQVGQPPIQYLTAWRMQLAARLLADGVAKVRTVAEAVGYDSEAAFSRAFKKHTGQPPAAWRSDAIGD